jgi:hypothetical protein
MRRRVPLFLFLLALVGSVFALSAPVPAPYELKKQDFERSRLNLKQIGVAFHDYASWDDGKFPSNITDKNGKPLLSWRVRLLPFVGEDALYKEFKLDEPWDSEHNKNLIAKIPKVYNPVRGKAKRGETFYQTFIGKDAVFGDGDKVPSLKSTFVDGTSNTAIVVEAGEAVFWTRPADLPFNRDAPLPKLGGMFDGDFHVAFADGGTVTLFKKDYDQDEMKKVIMPADGGIVHLEKLTK